MKMSLAKVYCALFLTVSVSGMTMAETVEIEDEFNSVQLERSDVAIEDHPERNPWVFGGPKKFIKCTDGILTLGSRPGAGEVKMYSKEKFSSGSFSAKIKLNNIGSGINVYIGFIEMKPWNNSSAWVMFNGSGNGHLYMKKQGVSIAKKDLMRIRTGILKPGQWYDLKVVWDVTGVELFVDGLSRGRLTDSRANPDQNLTFYCGLNTSKTEASFSLDSVVVKGNKKKSHHPARNAQADKKRVEIPVPKAPKTSAAINANEAVKISTTKNSAVVENGFYRYTFIDDCGLKLKELHSKFLSKNLLREPGRFIAAFANGSLLPNGDFAVTSFSKQGNKLIIKLKDNSRKIEGILEIRGEKNSPEIRVRSEFTNISDKKQTISFCVPVLDKIQIGEKITDDEFFYPMESGMAGRLDCELRQIYGKTCFMQLMSVWSPVAGGGVYAYTRANDGFPQILHLTHRSNLEVEPYSYNIISWPECTGAIFNQNALGTSLGWRHLDKELAAKEKFMLPDATIGVNSGIWQAGLKSYSDFVHTWFKKPIKVPRWYMELFSALSAHPHSGLWMYSRSPSPGYYNKKAEEYSYGKSMTHLERNTLQEMAYIWDVPAKFDIPTEKLDKTGVPVINRRHFGDYKYHEGRGGLAALKKEVDLIHSKQGRVIWYTFLQACAKGTEIYEKSKDWAMMSAPEYYKTSYTSDDMGWFFCDLEKGWADHFSKVWSKIVAETGSDGIRMDVLSRVEPCYNPKHAHYDGTLRGTVNPKMQAESVKTFRKAMYDVSPEKIVTVEHAGSDYNSQYHDGFFAENICWISESAQWGHFRNLNAYMTVFTHFYFPEIKTWIHGPSNTQEAILMSLFNSCGFACTSNLAIQAFRTLEENSDCTEAVGGERTPMIPTLNEGTFANYFGGGEDGKKVWNVLNRSGKPQNELIEVDGKVSDQFRYVEVYNDNAVACQERNGKLLFKCELADKSVAVITRFKKSMEAEIKDNELTVKCSAPGMTCQVVYDADTFRNPPENLVFTNGKLQLKLKTGARKVIVKLYSGKYVKDEIIFKR